MSDPWMVVAIAAGVIAAAGLYLLTRRPTPVEYAKPQEERLASRVAQIVGCAPADVLAAVRREIDIAPNQSDETLIKRAAYHYRQAIPETTCQIYRDPSPG